MKTASSAVAAEQCGNYAGEMILKKHSTIAEFRQQASEDEKTYFTFAGVRNPLDVAVSRYELRKQGRNMTPGQHEQQAYILQPGIDFSDFFFEFLVMRRSHNFDIALVPGDWDTPSFQSIDYVYRYEELESAFPDILRRIGVEPVQKLPVENKTKSKEDYLAYYDNWTELLAYKLFRDYMELWGYPATPLPGSDRNGCNSEF